MSGLGDTIVSFQPGAGSTSPLSLVAVTLITLATIVVGRQVASLWEQSACQRRAEWLREAEISKYRVTPIPKTSAE